MSFIFSICLHVTELSLVFKLPELKQGSLGELYKINELLMKSLHFRGGRKEKLTFAFTKSGRMTPPLRLPKDVNIAHRASTGCSKTNV